MKIMKAIMKNKVNIINEIVKWKWNNDNEEDNNEVKKWIMIMKNEMKMK